MPFILLEKIFLFLCLSNMTNPVVEGLEQCMRGLVNLFCEWFCLEQVIHVERKRKVPRRRPTCWKGNQLYPDQKQLDMTLQITHTHTHRVRKRTTQHKHATSLKDSSYRCYCECLAPRLTAAAATCCMFEMLALSHLLTKISPTSQARNKQTRS